jgi:hypothetical protein
MVPPIVAFFSFMQVGGDINVHPSFVGRMLHMSLGIDEQTAHNKVR